MKNILSLILILSISISLNAQKVLFLDAGHGGKDQGATSVTGVTEAEINFAFVKEIKELAEAKGIKVVLLSDAKEYTSLAKRAQKANDYELAEGESAMLISIHANFDEYHPEKSGPEVYVMRADERSAGSLQLANKFAEALGADIQERGLSILRDATMPAVMIETGYLSNTQEAIDLETPDMRTILVRKIVSVL